LEMKLLNSLSNFNSFLQFCSPLIGYRENIRPDRQSNRRGFNNLKQKGKKMPAKIRLQRYGKKGQPYYHIVVADSRAPRDGRYIERIGSYNPNVNPAFIDINTDKALSWLQKGAQPTDTTRAILSYTGVLYKKHLDVGVKKGALTQEQADEKFQNWLSEKREKVQSKRDTLTNKRESDIKNRLEAESKIKEARAKAVMAKASQLADEAAADQPADQVETAVAEAEASVEAPVEETTATEAPAEQAEQASQPEARAEAPEAEIPTAQAEGTQAEATAETSIAATPSSEETAAYPPATEASPESDLPSPTNEADAVTAAQAAAQAPTEEPAKEDSTPQSGSIPEEGTGEEETKKEG
jgi:small subunit ribosomal protein S16